MQGDEFVKYYNVFNNFFSWIELNFYYMYRVVKWPSWKISTIQNIYLSIQILSKIKLNLKKDRLYVLRRIHRKHTIGSYRPDFTSLSLLEYKSHMYVHAMERFKCILCFRISFISFFAQWNNHCDFRIIAYLLPFNLQPVWLNISTLAHRSGLIDFLFTW